MESKANYSLVGLMVLILTAALLATSLWLSVGFDQKAYDRYLVYLQEAATGLSIDSPVKFNGVKVGYVKKIQLNDQNPREVILLLSIEQGTPITDSTYATLISKGITGISEVGLAATNNDLTPLKRKAGELYPVIPYKPSLFNQLDKVLKEVSVNVNKVSQQVSRVFDKENTENFKKTLANVEKFSKVLADNSQNFDHVIAKINNTMDNFSKFSDDLPEITTDLKTGLKKINGMVVEVSKAGREVSSAMKSGREAIEQISQDTLPSFVTLLRRFDTIAANLEIVSNQMRQNPSVILRGTSPLKPGPGEK